MGNREGKNETKWDQEGDKSLETLNLTKQTGGSQGEGGREKVVGLWTLGRLCAMVSAMKCTPGANNTLYVNF